jgi:glutathione synthase/RimK-type ligase-like ATP-grasp enzyme
MIYCYDDKTCWGLMLAIAARKQGYDATLFKKSAEVPASATAFVRLDQKPNLKNKTQRLIQHLALAGVDVIPNIHCSQLYDNKLYQAQTLSKYMPPTKVITDPWTAWNFVGKHGLPIMSKASTGAGSKNVRYLETEEQCQEEVYWTIENSSGIDLNYKKVQRKYLLWQKFVPNNDHDIRVILVGDKALALKRHNRPDKPMASGSGVFTPIARCDAHVKDAIRLTTVVAAHIGTWFIGTDIVFKDNRPQLLEVTFSWSFPAYLDCVFFDTAAFKPRGIGAEMFDYIIEEIVTR